MATVVAASTNAMPFSATMRVASVCATAPPPARRIMRKVMTSCASCQAWAEVKASFIQACIMAAASAALSKARRTKSRCRGQCRSPPTDCALLRRASGHRHRRPCLGHQRPCLGPWRTAPRPCLGPWRTAPRPSQRRCRIPYRRHRGKNFGGSAFLLPPGARGSNRRLRSRSTPVFLGCSAPEKTEGMLIVAETDELEPLLDADGVRLVLAVRLDEDEQGTLQRAERHPLGARPRPLPHPDDAQGHTLGGEPGSICHPGIMTDSLGFGFCRNGARGRKTRYRNSPPNRPRRSRGRRRSWKKSKSSTRLIFRF